MVIVRIGIPQIALLTVPAAAKGKDEDSALLPQPSHSSDVGAAVQDRMDRTAEAETSDSDLDRTLDEEQLVSQLQTYFQESIRCAVIIHSDSCIASPPYVHLAAALTCHGDSMGELLFGPIESFCNNLALAVFHISSLSLL